MYVSLIYLVTLEYISTFPYPHPSTYRPIRISRKWLFLINYYTISIVSIVRLQISGVLQSITNTTVLNINAH